jgi:hypothetical protein
LDLLSEAKKRRRDRPHVSAFKRSRAD